ncbi:hypothetical protein GK047_18140 [Paenibacillus sp. SYP-B3998]|uniref:Lipoprotein n=1 Tax=Paenibacillus sp. SYP-B3998 TaxID=2678564 RepID=A0A6G4A0D2_9BACL|nr:hypothetical protein [Paenibacillus sp. SYP-B3998]NEW07923.1 hypothetical protein [Paenibacillus sp. SYP-B3998]
MKMKKLTGVCILIPILLSGCGNAPSAQNAAAAAVSTDQPAKQSQAQGTDQKQAGQGRPMMNQQQRQMFGTFQTLLMLDKAEGLAITKEEAQTMLPIAQDIVAKGELTEDSKAKLLEKLTDAQKKFVDDAAARMNNRGNGNGGNGKKNAEGGDAAKNTDSAAQADASKDAGKEQGQGSSTTKGSDGKGNSNGKGTRPTGEMKDPGKQLIELLQSKLK